MRGGARAVHHQGTLAPGPKKQVACVDITRVHVCSCLHKGVLQGCQDTNDRDSHGRVP